MATRSHFETVRKSDPCEHLVGKNCHTHTHTPFPSHTCIYNGICRGLYTSFLYAFCISAIYPYIFKLITFLLAASACLSLMNHRTAVACHHRFPQPWCIWTTKISFYICSTG